MGLLEKAESGNQPEKKSKKKAEKKPPAKAEPTPQKKKDTVKLFDKELRKTALFDTKKKSVRLSARAAPQIVG